MFANRTIATQFLLAIEPTLQKDRLDQLPEERIFEESNKALRVVVRDYPYRRELVNQFVNAAEAIVPSANRVDGQFTPEMALSRITNFIRTNSNRVDDGLQSIWIMAEIPIDAALEISDRLGDPVGYRKVETPGKYHITLAYCGKHRPENISDKAINDLSNSLKTRLEKYAPIVGNVTGTGRMKDGPDGSAFYVSPGLKGLVSLRQKIKEICAASDFPIQTPYDFIPHVTVGYLEPDTPTPLIDLNDEISLKIDTIRLSIEDTPHAFFRLNGDMRFDEMGVGMPMRSLEAKEGDKRVQHTGGDDESEDDTQAQKKRKLALLPVKTRVSLNGKS